MPELSQCRSTEWCDSLREESIVELRSRITLKGENIASKSHHQDTKAPGIPSRTQGTGQQTRSLSEKTFLSFRTERSEERNLENTQCFNERDFSLSLEMTVLGQAPGTAWRKSLIGRWFLIRQRDFFVGWAKAVALPTEECGFTSEVGKIAPLPTLRWNGIRVHFSLSY